MLATASYERGRRWLNMMRAMRPADCSPLVKLYLRALNRLGEDLAAIERWQEGQAPIHRLPDSRLRILVRDGILDASEFNGKQIHKLTAVGRALVKAMDRESTQHATHHHTPWRPIA